MRTRGESPLSMGSLMFGMLVGGAAMYFFDPDRGNYRRSLIRDQLAHFGFVSEDTAESTARDLRNRMQGTVAEAKGQLEEMGVATNR